MVSGGGATALLSVGYGLYRYRERRMETLYEEVCGLPPAWRGTKEAQAAVKELGTYAGDRSTEMLLSIALGQGAFPWPEVQVEAMRALAFRRDPRVADSLAATLQPHATLVTLQAATEALQSLPCGEGVSRQFSTILSAYGGVSRTSRKDDPSAWPRGLH